MTTPLEQWSLEEVGALEIIDSIFSLENEETEAREIKWRAQA